MVARFNNIKFSIILEYVYSYYSIFYYIGQLNFSIQFFFFG